MPFSSIPQTEPVTGRDRRKIAVIGVIVLAVFAGIGIWAAVRPGAYGASRNGCITVNVPSTTGGGLLHGCGSRAQAMCRNAYAGQGIAVQLTRQQCRIAGISPPSAPVSPSAS
jgi:uncharacterized membrane protein YeiH